MKFSNSNVKTLPVIIDAPTGLVDQSRCRLSDPIKLIFIANLVDNKNPQVFCEIVDQLNKLNISAVGTVIGDGPQRAGLESYCRDKCIRDKMTFLGKLDNQDVHKHLSQSDILISTSFGEPYGRSIVEAMSVGTPCICHKSGGPADFIKHNINGLLVDKIDSNSYANLIKYMLSDPLIWQRLSKGALLSASDWKSNVVLANLESDLISLTERHSERLGR